MEKVWKPWDLEGVECGRRSWIPLMLAVGPRRLVNISVGGRGLLVILC